jgi:hypothetical protein
MTQENLEIIGEESIALSLLQPEYPGLILSAAGSIASVESIDSENLIFQEDPIFPEYFIDSKDLIFPEYSIDSEDLIFPEGSIDSEYSIDSEKLILQEDSIAPQEIDSDPLTGMARNWWPWWPFPNNGSQVTALKDARLNISNDYIYTVATRDLKRVTATVKVELSSSDINSGGLRLQSSVWGIDNTWLDSRDDNLFYFPDQYISQSGTYTFSTLVASSVLDEDRRWYDDRDEIQASISLVSNSSPNPFNRRITTNIVTGYF